MKTATRSQFRKILAIYNNSIVIVHFTNNLKIQFFGYGTPECIFNSINKNNINIEDILKKYPCWELIVNEAGEIQKTILREYHENENILKKEHGKHVFTQRCKHCNRTNIAILD